MKARWQQIEDWYWELKVGSQVVAMVVSCHVYGRPTENSWFAYVDSVSADYPINRGQPTHLYEAMSFANSALC